MVPETRLSARLTQHAKKGPVFRCWNAHQRPRTAATRATLRGLVDAHTKIARKNGVEIRYDTRAVEILTDGHAVTGVKVRHRGS